MNSPLRATPDMKADGAERSPILLAQGDTLPAATRVGILTLERPATSAALDDIVAARMKDLADRLAADISLPKAVGVDAPLEQSDVVIQPVSLAAITGLRTRPIDDTDDDGWLPTTPMTAIAPPPAPTVAPTVSATASEAAAERNLKSRLDVLDPPAPLRLAGEGLSRRLIPVIPPARPLTESPGEVSDVPAADDDAGNDDLTPRAAPTPVTEEPLMLADQSAGDFRLVDLNKRQQSLLDQLNRYPPAPVPAASPAVATPGDIPLPPAWTVLDQLAPTQPIIPTEQHRSPPSDAPPPLPSTGVLRLAAPSPEDGEQRLTERSPMIIERARAERAGRQGANNPAASPGPLPAFAAGVAIAFAIAGSLLFVL